MWRQVHSPSCHQRIVAVLIGSWLGLHGAGGQPAKASRPHGFMGCTTLSVPKCKPLGQASTQVRKQGLGAGAQGAGDRPHGLAVLVRKVPKLYGRASRRTPWQSCVSVMHLSKA